MGEKYNEDAARGAGLVADPTGPGFPPPDYAAMQAWGERGRAALRDYLDRPAGGLRQLASDASTLLRDAAGSDAAARARAGERVVERMQDGGRDLRTKAAQGSATLRALHAEHTMPADELAAEARGSARGLRAAVTEHLGPLERLAGEVLAAAGSGVLDAVSARVEQAINDVGRIALEQAGELYAGLLPRSEPAGAAG